MGVFKEKLTALLNSKTIEGQNLKKLKDHFGEENIRRLPKKEFKFNTGTNRDGNNYRSICLTTGKINEWCDVAAYTINPSLTSEDLQLLEDAILKLLQSNETAIKQATE